MLASPTLLWLGLLFAFSPIVIDLLQHAVAQPWARAALVFPLLFFLAARASTAPVGASRWGLLAMGVGIVIGLLAIGGDVLRIGRVGLAVAAIGLVRARGMGSGPVAMLLLWSIPVPYQVAELGSPALESSWAAIGTRVAHALQIEVDRIGVMALAPGGGGVEFSAIDGGLMLGATAAGIGWFVAVAAGRPVRSACVFAAVAGNLALFAQALLVVGAVVSVGSGASPGVVTATLSHFPWIVVWIAAAAAAVRTLRSARATGVV